MLIMPILLLDLVHYRIFCYRNTCCAQQFTATCSSLKECFFGYCFRQYLSALKKGCLYIIFFILLINQTSLNQFFKVPALVAHFIEHHGMDEKVGFIDFLSMHYWGTDLNDNDQDKDMKLPFKKVDEYSAFSIAIPTVKTSLEKQHFYTLSRVPQVTRNFSISDPALSALFRPPRM